VPLGRLAIAASPPSPLRTGCSQRGSASLPVMRPLASHQGRDAHVDGFAAQMMSDFGKATILTALATAVTPPNQSRHTQIDGPTEAKPYEDTESNKSITGEVPHRA
jgi:hypothetical protein